MQQIRESKMCVGLTGVNWSYDYEVALPMELAETGMAPPDVICTGDAQIIHASHTCLDHGSAILCNMGSTACVLADGKYARFDGWGPAIGDEGSACWMGREALRAISEECDRKRPESDLWKHISDWLHKPDRAVYAWKMASLDWADVIEEFRRYGYDTRIAALTFAHRLSLESAGSWRTVCTGLSKPIMDAYVAGDAAAKWIAEEAARLLAKQFEQASGIARGLSAGRPVSLNPLVLSGGVFRDHPCFREVVLEELSERKLVPQGVEVITQSTPGTMRPACGALLFALGNSKSSDLHLPDVSIINRLARDQAHLHSRGDLLND